MAYHYDAPISAGDPQLDRLIEAPLPVALIFWQERAALDALSPTLIEMARQHAGHLIVARLHMNDAPLGRRRFGVEQTPLLIGLRRGHEVTRARLSNREALQIQMEQLLNAAQEPGAKPGKVQAVNDANFEREVLAAPGLVLVEFAAPWLPLCLLQSRMIDRIAWEYAGRLRVVRVHVEENPHSAGIFAVQSLPTLVFVRHGEEIGRISEVIEAGELRRRIDRMIG